jgi:hypothetical protein
MGGRVREDLTEIIFEVSDSFPSLRDVFNNLASTPKGRAELQREWGDGWEKFVAELNNPNWRWARDDDPR